MNLLDHQQAAAAQTRMINSLRKFIAEETISTKEVHALAANKDVIEPLREIINNQDHALATNKVVAELRRIIVQQGIADASKNE